MEGQVFFGSASWNQLTERGQPAKMHGQGRKTTSVVCSQGSGRKFACAEAGGPPPLASASTH